MNVKGHGAVLDRRSRIGSRKDVDKDVEFNFPASRIKLAYDKLYG